MIDVSFISLGLVLGPVISTASAAGGGRIVPLVKPQFEAGRESVPGGVVRDPAVHLPGPRAGRRAGAAALGLAVAGAIASPLLGPEGNREFLLDLHLGPATGAGAASGEAPADPTRPSSPSGLREITAA